MIASEAGMIAALAKRFAAPEFAFMSHVRNGTGFSRRTTRTADALAFGLYPSRGLELHGFEIKVTRADWKAELKEPEKAEAIQAFCDRWWIAIGDESIVQPGELPPTWGLLLPKGDKLVVKVEAPKLEAKPLDKLMLAAILRRATEDVIPRSSIEMLIHEKVNAEVEHRMSKSETGVLQRQIDALTTTIEDFEKRSGIDIRGWDRNIAEAARKIASSDRALAQAVSALDHPEDVLRRALKAITDARKELRTSNED